VLISKCKTYFTGEITLHIAQIVNTEQLNTMCPTNMVCFRYIFVNTLHNGDNKKDDDDNDDDDDDDNNNNNNNNNNNSLQRI